MPEYKYLIIGGAMTAEAAVQGIRETDADGSIGVISAESHPPYNRPPLSKGLWKGAPMEKVWRSSEDMPAELHLGRSARSIDRGKKKVTDDEGTVYTYSKLLLATGGTPLRLPFGEDQILYFRTLDDYNQLRSMTEKGKHFAVIGGGFIGSEIAAALTMNDAQVTMLFPEEGIGGRIFPSELSLSLNDYYREKGVDVLAGVMVNAVESSGDAVVVKTDSGKEIKVDGVVAGIGIKPNVELAEAAGLEVDNGIVVNKNLITNDQDIYAAGDVAAFYNPALDTRMRVEHEDNANTMGKMAGQNMTGQAIAYDHLPFYYSDMFDRGYEAVGELDSRMETVIDWQEPFLKGVIYYMKEGRVRGVLLWDNWGQVDAARELIAESGPFTADDLKGRLP